MGLRDIPDKLSPCLCVLTRCLLLRYPRSKTKIQTPSYDRIAGIPASRKTTTGLSSGRWSLGTSSSLVVNSGKLVVSCDLKNPKKPCKPCIYWLFTTPVAFLAEKGGFEPSKPFWGLHDFQSCALDQARRLLRVHKIAQWLYNLCVQLSTL